jgi:CheY-like chemotaxis protein
MTRLLIATACPVGAACRRSFFRRGYQVETAATGAECLAILHQFLPDVLVLDLQLPGGAGLALDWLRRPWGRQSVPAVVLIGDEPSQVVTGMILTSPVVEAYLQKPFRRPVLLEVIGSVAVAVRRRAMRA